MTLETRFSHFSDYLFINLLNTVNSKNKTKADLLDEEGMMDEWLSLMKEKGLLSEQQVNKIKEKPVDRTEMKQFRDTWRSYFTTSDHDEDGLQSLINLTKKTPLSFEMNAEDLMPIPDKGGTAGLQSLLAFTMLNAYQDGIFEKVKGCSNETCLALFVDPKGKRKWCSMKVCGNRAKAQKHYEKRKQ
ncbi:CGNR zinc finger domain-containing protein [Pontibacillus salipaludis]|uniref:CGNR zinc finger domain-containing protein n=1 Tax=Pontibacillus salipaludis TaxID=1697394 RepID=UPI0031E51706